MPRQSALVLGATGSFGGAVMAELAARGWQVRALVRKPARLAPRAKGQPQIEAVRGDATDAEAVRNALQGISVLVMGVNYPYDRWVPHMRQAVEAAIAAAEAEEATIVFPGNVYPLGPAREQPFTESDSFQPSSRKGKLRAELEELLRQAAERGKARVLIVRAGDFFGPTVRNGLVDPLFGNARKHKTMFVFGRQDIPHQWAFVPDLARMTADLLERREQLRPFELVHFKGHIVDPAGKMPKLAAIAAGLPELRNRRIPWMALRIVGLFNGVVRELMELRYLFDTSVIIDDPRRRELLPDFRDTPLEVAVLQTVDSYV